MWYACNSSYIVTERGWGRLISRRKDEVEWEERYCTKEKEVRMKNVRMNERVNERMWEWKRMYVTNVIVKMCKKNQRKSITFKAGNKTFIPTVLSFH